MRHGQLIAANGFAIIITTIPCLAGPTPTATLRYESRDNVGFLGQINTPFNPGLNGGPGFFEQSVADDGQSVVHVGLFNPPNADEALLRGSMGLNPFLGWTEGFLDAPLADHGVRDILRRRPQQQR